jgi:archaellum component FlaF (FlaF/FlaG flagellin family)
MRNNYTTVINKFSTLTRPVELYDTAFHINQYALINALSKYQAHNSSVYLLSNSQLYLVGYVYDVYNTEATVDLLDNSYGSFVQRMLYHAVNYKLIARGLGQVSYDQKTLLGFKISHILISSYTKWF